MGPAPFLLKSRAHGLRAQGPWARPPQARGPIIAGMRRIASAESAPEAADSTLVQRARQRIRRFIFSANRTMWFSACELGVFLATGDSCVKTEENTKVFSGKGIAMMHECKRLLNHSTAAEGLLLARSSTQRAKVGCTIMEALRVDKVVDLPSPAPNSLYFRISCRRRLA